MSSHKCPACRFPLPEGVSACPHCALVLDGEGRGAQPGNPGPAAKPPTTAAELVAEKQYSETRAAAGIEPAAVPPASSGQDSLRQPARAERVAEDHRARSASIAENRAAQHRREPLPTATLESSVADEVDAAAPEPVSAPTAAGDGAWTSAPELAAAVPQVEQASMPAEQPHTPGVALTLPAQAASAVMPAARRRLSQPQIALIVGASAVVFWLIVNAIAHALGIG